MHITMNTIVQLFLGLSLELVDGWWRVGIIYLAGGLAGSLGTSLCNPTTKLIGASGGVYALIVGMIVERYIFN
jgi:rhomboid-related protein 1/2/3